MCHPSGTIGITMRSPGFCLLHLLQGSRLWFFDHPHRTAVNDNGSMNCISEVRTAGGHARPSATDLAKLCFQEIEAQNPAINAYLAVSPERAFRAAAAIDRLVAEGSPLPPLAGVPIGVKDVMVMKGSPQPRGYGFFEGSKPRLIAPGAKG